MKMSSMVIVTTAVWVTSCCVLADEVAGGGESAPNRTELGFTAEQYEFFERKVRPVLVSKCFHCHGTDVQENGLRLDGIEAILAGGERGPALARQTPSASLLIKAISHQDEKLKMPPEQRLSEEQVQNLTRWVRMGAPWPKAVTAGADSEIDMEEARQFWAFRALTKPQIPRLQDAGRDSSPIDRFMRARLETQGLTWVASADRRTLLRRAYFDLIGLPPTPEEVHEFLEDGSPDAFATVVDRLLASPHYGERWARYWLDVARYGESDAASDVNPYKVMFRYRDWVVQALNEDLTFDRFVELQLAGDQLAGIDPVRGKTAVGFLGMLPLLNKPGADKCPIRRKEVRANELDNQLDMVCKSFLALTVTCARCHDHKFDPIPTEDYYALTGIFWSSQEVPDLEVEPGITIRSYRDGKPQDSRVHIRGNIRDQGELVPRRFLTVLSPKNAPRFTQGSGRLELARALVQTPLTWRVMANRVWQHHFGRGIVDTPNNFGKLGSRPSHPELLEWLASVLRETGSLKALHREIMLSGTYQLSSTTDVENDQRDPANRYLWRMNRRRLDVEALRDAILFVTGELKPVIGGASIDPREDASRRTLYSEVIRFVRKGDYSVMDFLSTFDFPNPRISVGSRAESTVPQQQLFLLNSNFIAERSRRLAAKLKAQTSDDETLVRLAFEVLYARPAEQEEVRMAIRFLKEAGQAEEALAAEAQLMLVLLAANEFLYID